MNNASKRRGYSMIEAIVSATVLAVGIVAVLRAYTALSKTNMAVRTSEQMQRLALDKYDELVATGSLDTQTLQGDFSDRGNDKFQWDATVDTTGVENLSALTVNVEPRQGDDKVSVTGLIYEPPANTGSGTGGAQ